MSLGSARKSVVLVAFRPSEYNAASCRMGLSVGPQVDGSWLEFLAEFSVDGECDAGRVDQDVVDPHCSGGDDSQWRK